MEPIIAQPGLNDESLSLLERIGSQMPGGFFIYKAEQPEELIYANRTVFELFGCKDLLEFKELTGYTFKGMLHPDDYKSVSKSIANQINNSRGNMDFVEYRIIRKDGSIRWVDDYGHYTESDTYGGVYYVFISDVTQKKELSKKDKALQRKTQEENKRLVEEIESAAKLAELMASASSLLTNMPAMSFSKDASTGKYLACNQSFAKYAHRNTPDEVVGLTDYEIFDYETARHFIEDDKKTLSMEKPYMFFEDVPDAKGKMRNLQTTKMKFTDSDGRLCTLGLCVDVTEMTRIKSAEAEARIKQQELEEKIALQEKLLKQSETLRDALKEAENANRAKSSFLSNMSHEIRTPITAILGMNELIQRECKDEGIIAYANNIEQAGKSLLSIINDILDFSKIEAGHMELVNADYNVRDLLSNLINLVRFRIEDKGLVLKTEIDPEIPLILNGDELRIKQIITNLLVNAAKYTEKGHVTLEFKLLSKDEKNARLYIAVKDTGCGIRNKDMEKLFMAFDRLDLVRTRSIEGSGLGLPIASQLLALMDSHFEVKSSIGKGSVFSFELTQRISENTEIGKFDPFALMLSGDNQKKDDIDFIAPEARVLIVDDTPLNLQVIVGLLNRTQIDIKTAASGKECIELFGAEEFDMVFMDYRMPELDGIETLRKLYEDYPQKAEKTVIICLTASAVVGDREKMLSAGFDDYLSKPINFKEMEKKLIKYLPAGKVEKSSEITEESEIGSLPEELLLVDGLDPMEGIEFCGDTDLYLSALKLFSSNVEQKAAEIEEALNEPDLKNYVVYVHALKSSSKTMGAQELSEYARSLEIAGKEGDYTLIKNKTPKLLEMYRSLTDSVKNIVSVA